MNLGVTEQGACMRNREERDARDASRSAAAARL